MVPALNCHGSSPRRQTPHQSQACLPSAPQPPRRDLLDTLHPGYFVFFDTVRHRDSSHTSVQHRHIPQLRLHRPADKCLLFRLWRFHSSSRLSSSSAVAFLQENLSSSEQRRFHPSTSRQPTRRHPTAHKPPRHDGFARTLIEQVTGHPACCPRHDRPSGALCRIMQVHNCQAPLLQPDHHHYAPRPLCEPPSGACHIPDTLAVLTTLLYLNIPDMSFSRYIPSRSVSNTHDFPQSLRMLLRTATQRTSTSPSLLCPLLRHST